MGKASLRSFLLSFVVMWGSSNVVLGQTILADVQVNSPIGEWKPLDDGERVFGPWGVGHWEGIPRHLQDSDLTFWHITTVGAWPAVAWGITEFEVLTDGPVWMLTTTRFGEGGNPDGNWLPEVTTREELELDGWREIYAGIGDTSVDHSYLIFERYSTAGETFTIRTEKYVPPLIITGSVIPEPMTVGIIGMSAMALFVWRVRRSSTVR